MKLFALVLFAVTVLSGSFAQACAVYRSHSPMIVGHVTEGKVVSTLFGPVGEIRGSDVYSSTKGLVGHVYKRSVTHANGSFAAFAAAGQLINSQNQPVAVTNNCTPLEAGAAYLLLF